MENHAARRPSPTGPHGYPRPNLNQKQKAKLTSAAPPYSWR